MTDRALKSKPEFNIFKRWWFWVALVLIALVTWWLMSPAAENPKVLTTGTGEQLVVSGVNQAIAQSALDGTGEITNFDCLALSKIAIRNGGDFYSNTECEPSSMGFVAKSVDTVQSNTITFYPRTGGSIVNCKANIASFTFNTDRTELLSYSFKEGDCFQGSKLPVSKIDVQNTQDLLKYVDTNNYKQVEGSI
jgi:hypothetical protein